MISHTKRIAAFVLLLLFSGNAAQSQIVGQAQYQAHDPICLDVQADVPAGAKANAIWKIDAPAQLRRKSATEVFVWAPPGKYKVQAMLWITKRVTVDGVQGDLMLGPPQEFHQSLEVTSTDARPDKKPSDEEQDSKQRSPFTEEGLQILIVYETDELGALLAARRNQLYSKTLRDWALVNCKQVNGQACFRVLDKDASATGEPWASALRRKRTALPWLIAGNGTKGFEGPLPENLQDTLDILKGLAK